MSETSTAPEVTQPTESQESADVSQESQTGQTSANTAKDTQPEASKKYQIKVNGVTREMTIEQLIAHASKGIGADEKFQKASALTKKTETLVKKLKEDPDTVLRELLGRDPEELYKERLAKKLEELSLDPKEKELRDYKRKVEEYEAKEKERIAKEESERQSKAVEGWVKHYDKELPEAIRAAGLPLSQDVIKMTADIMIANLEEGLDLPMNAVMEIVKEKYVGSVKNFLTAVEKEKLVELLGEDVAEAVIKAHQTKKQKEAPKVKIAVSGESEPKTPKSYKDAQKELDERIKRWAAGE